MNVEDLEKQRAILIEYSRMKLEAGDWHGLSDSANDLREIDAKLSVVKPRDYSEPKCECGHSMREHTVCDGCEADQPKPQVWERCPCLEYRPRETEKVMSGFLKCHNKIGIFGGDVCYCQLPAGHEGKHKDGNVTWPNDAEPTPLSGEVKERADLQSL